MTHTVKIWDNHPLADRFHNWATERQLIVEVNEARAGVERVEARNDTRGTHGARKRLVQVTARLIAWRSA